MDIFFYQYLHIQEMINKYLFGNLHLISFHLFKRLLRFVLTAVFVRIAFSLLFMQLLRAQVVILLNYLFTIVNKRANKFPFVSKEI